MTSQERKIAYRSSLNVSEVTKRNYFSSIRGSLLCDALEAEFGTKDLFAIVDLEKLWKVYCYINLHPKNIATHRNISCALMSYIKFLNNGQRYGKRIDFAKPRGSKLKS